MNHMVEARASRPSCLGGDARRSIGRNNRSRNSQTANYTAKHAVPASTFRARFHLTIVLPKTSVGRFPCSSAFIKKRFIRRKDAPCCVGRCFSCFLCCRLCRLSLSLL